MADTPGPPTDLQATQEAGLVTLTWTAPEDDGGSPILEYNILRGDSIENLTVMNKVGTGTTFTDTTAER
ncbi:MAG: fibronectin type III domain-containing protein, partial [Thermoplasmata archaeon]